MLSRTMTLLASASALRMPMPSAAARPASRVRTLMCSADAGTLEDRIKEDIKANSVVIYSKTTCPFCGMTKKLFDSLEVTLGYSSPPTLHEAHRITLSLAGALQRHRAQRDGRWL